MPLNQVSLLQDLLAGYTFEALLPFKATVVQVSPDYDVYLKLGRTQIYAAGITQVLQDADRYGQCSMMNSSSRETCKGTGKACINVTCLSENLDWPGFSISHLRSLLLSEHVSSLLQANGYTYVVLHVINLYYLVTKKNVIQ